MGEKNKLVKVLAFVLIDLAKDLEHLQNNKLNSGC